LDQGKKTNLTHPCIGALCVQFYYGSAGGKYPLAKAFPEDFRTSIPEHAVAVAMTTVNTSVTLFAKTYNFIQIYNCIDEYRNGEHTPKTFSSENYHNAYETIIRIISMVNGSPYHKRKWDQARQQWAQQGM
jgi:Domain of unknown function (DUF6532)